MSATATAGAGATATPPPPRHLPLLCPLTRPDEHHFPGGCTSALLAAQINSLRRGRFQKPAGFDAALDAAIEALPANDSCHDDVLGMGIRMSTLKNLGVFGPCQRCRADVLRAVVARIMDDRPRSRAEQKRLHASFVNTFGSRAACDHIEITGVGWLSR